MTPPSGFNALIIDGPVVAPLDPSAVQAAHAIILNWVNGPAELPEALAAATAPTVLMADVDATTARRLIAGGAAAVLPTTSTLSEIATAVDQALRRRADPPEVTQVFAPEGAEPVGTVPAAAVERLVGGMAHEFNNLIQVIGGNAEVLLQEPSAAVAERVIAESIVAAARRATRLTQRLLAYAGRLPFVVEPVDVGELVTDAVRALQPRMGVIRLTARIDPAARWAMSDRAQLLDVLATLADNAAHAMPDGGACSITVGTTEVSEAIRVSRPWLRAGSFVQIEVRDTGPGIAPDVLPHVFEPFYSTTWGSAGLGLSAAYSIVKQSGGHIWIESDPRGTCVTMLLPVVGIDRLPDAAEDLRSARRSRVLLVEDDEDVRELLNGVLVKCGYTVTAVGSGEEALACGDAFECLLTDVRLPNVNGPQLAKQVRRQRPWLPVLFISGDTAHALDPGDLDEATGLLYKPFSGAELTARVEQLLTRARLSGR